MTPNIDHLTEAELIDLNRRIVERLKFLAQMRAHARMLDFSVGDRVSFQPDGRPVLFGVLTRYNKKTVTVITEGGEHWTVSPHLLRKVMDVAPDSPARQSALPLGHP
ncbi:MAG: hypothetical protein B7Y41_09955 [Hydrogenophilales bacterium 28-61-23]|nr:MAG: hypothetical protein B7Y41_09955 [Hydrogenophilales bacterium 28-61-23]